MTPFIMDFEVPYTFEIVNIAPILFRFIRIQSQDEESSTLEMIHGLI